MRFGRAVSLPGKAARRLLRVAGRPVRRAQGRGGVVVQPYRGYGSATEVFLIGRVFHQSPAPRGGLMTLGRLLHDVGRRVARRAVADAPVVARFAGCVQRVRTDPDGYFRLHLTLPVPLPEPGGWHSVALTLEAPERVEATAQVFIPPADCRQVVISDIDDTVMVTGVANVAAMLWRLFVQGAGRRTAFPGVSAFYRALHDGAGGREGNPMLYVSRAPWGIYDVLDEFFRRNAIPVGPILFLREWGLRWTSPLPRKAEDHKESLIDHMLEIYRDLPVVLIGDSGQHDPEVYRRIVVRHGDRVRAVYIRNVSGTSARAEEVRAMAAEAARHGAALVLADDTVAMAEHAAGLGLMDPARIAAVRGEKAAEEAADQARTPPQATKNPPEQSLRRVRPRDPA